MLLPPPVPAAVSFAASLVDPHASSSHRSSRLLDNADSARAKVRDSLKRARKNGVSEADWHASCAVRPLSRLAGRAWRLTDD